MVDISIIIPCYNEVNNIAKIAYQIDKIKSDGIDCLAIGIGLMPGNSLQIKNQINFT